MTKYPPELKEKLVARMLGPDGISAEALARESGVPAGVLRRWRQGAQAAPVPGLPAARRLEALAATWNMTQDEASAWCREHGIFPTELNRWRQEALRALASPAERRAMAAEAKAEWARNWVLIEEARPQGSRLAPACQAVGSAVRTRTRPRVSNDNPFVESVFRTAKYHPKSPEKPFASIHEARIWGDSFVTW